SRHPARRHPPLRPTRARRAPPAAQPDGVDRPAPQRRTDPRPGLVRPAPDRSHNQLTEAEVTQLDNSVAPHRALRGAGLVGGRRAGYAVAMLADDQILRSMRDRIDHPATIRELLQALKIPREERPAFRRRLKQLVATGA